MRIGTIRILVLGVTCLWLAGCNANTNLSESLDLKTPGADAYASVPPADDAREVASQPGEPAVLGNDPNDDLSVGKKNYRAKNYGMAEKSFRRAAEMHPRDAEAWLGLAASYDRLRRFDLADRAYDQAIGIVGPTVEILNNQGYSYMLRGDYRRAQEKLATAQRKDPRNRFVLSNLQLLEESSARGKGLE